MTVLSITVSDQFGRGEDQEKCPQNRSEKEHLRALRAQPMRNHPLRTPLEAPWNQSRLKGFEPSVRREIRPLKTRRQLVHSSAVWSGARRRRNIRPGIVGVWGRYRGQRLQLRIIDQNRCAAVVQS